VNPEKKIIIFFRRAISPLGCGILFGAGLALSGMVQPQKVLGFLDVAGAFDPTLAVVMAAALAVLLPAQALARRRPAPLRASAVAIMPLRVDRRLVAGAALFGVGWGLSGFCPGPGIAAAGVGLHDALWFLPGMIAGMLLFRAWEAHADRAPVDETGFPVPRAEEPAS
jgi:uncharacterized membrane protein YedE/YeeE